MPRVRNHLVVDVVEITQKDRTGANYVARPLIHDMAWGTWPYPGTREGTNASKPL